MCLGNVKSLLHGFDDMIYIWKGTVLESDRIWHRYINTSNTENRTIQVVEGITLVDLSNNLSSNASKRPAGFDGNQVMGLDNWLADGFEI